MTVKQLNFKSAMQYFNDKIFLHEALGRFTTHSVFSHKIAGNAYQ